ncbi:U2 snRNP complex subunit msl1 [Ancistrocladus abbreviatus]
MAGIRFSMLKSIYKAANPSSRGVPSRYFDTYMNCVKAGDHFHVRPFLGSVNHSFHIDSGIRMVNFGCQMNAHLSKPCYVSAFAPVMSNSRVRSSFLVVSVTPTFTSQFFSSHAGSRGDGSNVPAVPESSGKSEVNVSGDSGSDWMDMLKDAWQSVIDAVTVTGRKAKEASDQLTPYAQQLLDSHPYLRDVVVPVGGMLTATLLAWLVMPKILRKFHRYATQGSATLLSGSIFGGEVKYENSFWGALEDPMRYVVTFMAFTQIGKMVAPDVIASQYIAQAWRAAVILSFIWFLYRWKTSVFSRALAAHNLQASDRHRLFTLDKVTSVGLFVIGLMALAESSGVAVQSMLTVGGIGGVATAFAAKDILGNVLSGLAVQFSHPFSVGDTIKAGSIEGQVVEMGLTTTSLLNAERFPVIVPNSMFSSQVIVNKSRAQWRAFVTKIPLQLDNVEKIPQISDDIKTMLRSNPKVFLGQEAPYCFLSRIESSCAELTLGCNLKHMSKDELYATEQDILLQSVQIIKQHGAALGSTYSDMMSQ